MAVVEREVVNMQKSKKMVKKPITFKDGLLTIENVPHLEKTEYEFVEYYIPSSVSLKVSVIAEYMEDYSISVFNFEKFDETPEIQDYLVF